MKLKVLLLEDRAADAELMLREVRRAGYEPEWKRVETQADYLAQLEQGWEVILADYNLPQFTGLRALELLRERGLDLPFILVSGTIGEDQAVAAMKAGANDYVMKEKLARLGPAVERVLHEAGERRKCKRAEETMRESEERLRMAQAAAHLGIWDYDLKTRRAVWTAEQEALWGFAPGTYDGSDGMFEQLIHPADRPRLAQAIAKALETGAFDIEFRATRRDGALRWFAGHGQTYYDAEGRPARMIGVNFDITERKRAEEAVRKREADLQLAQQIGHIGSWESDLASGTLVWSNESYRIFGCDPAAFVPTREGFFQLVHADDRARVREAVEESIRNGTDYEVDHRIRRPDGTERIVAEKGHPLRDAQGKAERLVGTTQDITERKRAEEELRFRNAILSTQQETSLDGILVVDENGGIISSNRRFAELWGIPSDILASKSDERALQWVMDRLAHPDEFMSKVKYLYQAREETSRDEVALKDGRTFDRYSAPMAGGDGKHYGRVWYFRDLTEHKKLEVQFLRAQRLEAVGTLAGGIAHDLNNILAPIRMVAPLLREAQTPAERAENVDLIEASTQRATDVVRQLLTFSRGQSGQRITLHLKHLLRDLGHVIRETFPKNIRFALAEAPDLWPLVADATQMHQILLNLCINARDAMPEGGTLAVTAANFQADDHYADMTTDVRPGAYLHLRVSDTGTGIRPEDLDKIFDPFFTTKEMGCGTGLGLATVHRVVTGHGGFVRVRSEVGKGTTFDVYLPASPEAVAPAEPALPASLLAGHGELILVVDDEEHVRRITQRTLVRHGYRVVTASDGAGAIAVFARHQGEVKVVVTDLMMPVIDGLGLVKVLAQMKPGLPVILATGLGENPEQNQRLAAVGRLGVSIVLTKPYTADELLNALHAVLTAK